MSTLTNTSVVDYSSDLPPLGGGRAPNDANEPRYGGLTLSAWLKIGIIALLMAILFRFNLARLWSKTNAFTGQNANWEHSFIIPFIGLYYLYVWRQDLLKPKLLGITGALGSTTEPRRWTAFSAWGLFSGIVLATLFLILAALPPGVDFPYHLAVRLWDRFGIPWVAVVAVVLVGAGGYLAFANARTLIGTAGQRSLSNVWAALGVGLMVNFVGWVFGWLVFVLSTPLFDAARYVLAALGLATIAAAVLLRNNAAFQATVARLARPSAAWFGAFVMVFGILFSLWGIYPGQNDFFKDVGMVISLFGVVTLLAGWPIMRTAWFPIVFLFCAIPWPDKTYSQLAGPLQLLGAKVAVYVLQIAGVDSAQFGTKITMRGNGGEVRTLNVAEACAGLRSLMTFVSVAGAVAFLSARPLWQKLVISASAVPIAILCNVMRVSGQGLLDYYVSQEMSQGFAHSFAGLLMLGPGFLLILLVCWILDHLFIEEIDEADRAKARGRLATAGGAKPAAAKLATPTAPGMVATALAPAPAPAPAPAASTAPARPGVAPIKPAPAATVGIPANPAAKAPATRAAAAPAPAAGPARPATAPVARPPAPAPAQTPAAPVPRPAGPAVRAPMAVVQPKLPAAVPAGVKPAAPAQAGRPAGAVPGATAPAARTVGVPGPAKPAGAPAAAAGQPARPAVPKPPVAPAKLPLPKPPTAGDAAV